MYDRHYEDAAHVHASASAVFAFVDNHAALSAHMEQPSWMMGGGKMVTSIDAGRGQTVGSHIMLRGRVFGLTLELDEIVLTRTPPSEKTWATVGTPRLIVIGRYRMGIRIRPTPDGAHLVVSLDYNLPDGAVTYWLGPLFSPIYARWCVRQMIAAVTKQFAGQRRVTAAA
jgi:hypothetical protein